MKNRTFVPCIVTIIFAILLGVTFFLPLADANDEYSELIRGYSTETAIEECDYSYGDLVNISMFEFANIYKVGTTLDEAGSYGKTESVICFVIIIAVALFTLLTLLFSLLKKPVPLIIFNLLALGAFSLLMWDMGDRKVLPSSQYNFGIAYILYYICFTALLAGGIWLLVGKISDKRNGKKKEVETEI